MPATVSFPSGPAQVRAGVWTAIQQPSLLAVLQQLDYGMELGIARDRDRYMADMACRKLGGVVIAHTPDFRYGEDVSTVA